MGKGASLAIEVHPNERESVFLALARTIITEIERGRLKPGDPLPGTRALAKSLKLNRNTVDAAYHELTMQGWLATEQSRGTFVATDLPDIAPGRLLQPAAPAVNGAIYTPQQPSVSLSDGAPDVRLVPTAEFAQAFRRALYSAAFIAGGSYGDPKGSRNLREALAVHMQQERGLAVHANEVLITRGSQMALYLAASSVTVPGQAIAVEQPGYPLAWSSFRAAGAEVIGVPVDAGGLMVDQLELIVDKNPHIKAVYVTPHHQYPTTVTLGASRRLQLMELARRRDLVIIEDDYDNEYRFDGRPILPLAARRDSELQIIYIGSLSKLLAPGIRVGYAVAPPKILMQMADRREALDRQGDVPLEHALAELLVDGTIRRHARKARRVYQERRDAMAALLTEKFSDCSDFILPAGGLAIWLKLNDGLSAETWSANADKLGLSTLPGIRFGLDTARPPEAFRLGFAGLEPREMRRAITLLAESRPDAMGQMRRA